MLNKEARKEIVHLVEHLVTEYYYATECNLATLGELCMLKSSSKSRIKRQRSICKRMLMVCLHYESYISDETNNHPGTRAQRNCPRVFKYLAAIKSEPEGLDGLLDGEIREYQQITAGKTHG